MKTTIINSQQGDGNTTVNLVAEHGTASVKPGILPEQAPFTVGERVTWTHVKGTGRGGMSFSTREGKVSEVREHSCIVKQRNGKLIRIQHTGLTKANQPSALTQMVKAWAEDS